MTFSASVILLQIEIHQSTMDDYVKIEKIGEGSVIYTFYIIYYYTNVSSRKCIFKRNQSMFIL